MSLAASSPAAAVAGLVRSDPHGPGITRVRGQEGFNYRDPSGAEITDAETLGWIRALRIPPAWENVWISADPLGHIQATGIDSKGRTQYLYHQLWREQRDAQKFSHMLRFAGALPGLRTAALGDLKRRGLSRERVLASMTRLIDLGLFRIGNERYAELDHHYGVTTLQKQHVRLMRDGMMFDYIAKAGKHRTIIVKDQLVLPVVRALARSDNGLDTLFCYQDGVAWHMLHSRDLGQYIATQAGGHFTAKEFRTWNATVLMALVLANAGPAPAERTRKRVVSSSVRQVARWLGDTPSVTRASYIDPRLISRYESDGQLPPIPAPAVLTEALAGARNQVLAMPPVLPVPVETETAIAALLAACDERRGRGG